MGRKDASERKAVRNDVSLNHPFPPVYDSGSRILILGTMPSRASRMNQFYYGHPQNRFWKVLAAVLGDEVPMTVESRKAFLLSHGIALWDVLKSCNIRLSQDSSIREPVCNDFGDIIRTAAIRMIFTNGKKADELYRRFALPQTGINSVCLPSTSPANQRYSFAMLVAEWRKITEYLY